MNWLETHQLAYFGMRQAKNACSGIQSTDAASKKQMLAKCMITWSSTRGVGVQVRTRFV
jgi:hypothetical protein